MIDGISTRARRLSDADRGVASLGALAVGVGAGGLAAVVPFHWPLTIAAMVAVAVGWFLYARKRRACAAAACTVSPPARATFAMLCVATVIVGISSIWGFIEQPLMRMLGGA